MRMYCILEYLFIVIWSAYRFPFYIRNMIDRHNIHVCMVDTMYSIRTNSQYGQIKNFSVRLEYDKPIFHFYRNLPAAVVVVVIAKILLSRFRFLVQESIFKPKNKKRNKISASINIEHCATIFFMFLSNRRQYHYYSIKSK